MWSHMLLGILYSSLNRGLKRTPNSHMPWCPPSSFWALDTIFPSPPSSCCSLSSEQGVNLYVSSRPLGHQLNYLWCGALHPQHQSKNATPRQLTTQLITHSHLPSCTTWTKKEEEQQQQREQQTQPRAHFMHKQRPVTMRLWEPKSKCPKAVVPTHLQRRVLWSPTLQCTVMSYVTGPCTKCYFNECLFHAGPHTWWNRLNQRLWVFEEEVYSPFRKRCPLRRPRHLIRVRVRVGSSPGDHRSRIGRKTHFGALSHTFTNFRGMLEGTFSFECHGLPMVFC